MKSPDIFLDRIESRGIVVGTNNADDVPVGTLFTHLVKTRREGSPGSGHFTELWSTPIGLRLTDAIINRKSVPVVPAGWGVGMVLEGVGLELIETAIREKQQGEFIHLRVAGAA